jgi:hypothetical protein
VLHGPHDAISVVEQSPPAKFAANNANFGVPGIGAMAGPWL